MIDWGAIATIVGIIIAVVGAAFAQSQRIDRQFSNTREFVSKRVDDVKEYFTQKLDYHERHDDQRFANINDNIWSLRVDHATQTALQRSKAKSSTDEDRDVRRTPILEGEV